MKLKLEKEPLEVIKVGSHLHGLATKNSDEDLLVIYPTDVYSTVLKKLSRTHKKISDDLELKEMDMLQAIVSVLTGKDIETTEVALSSTKNVLSEFFKDTKLTENYAYTYILATTLARESYGTYKKVCNISGKVDLDKFLARGRLSKELTKQLRRKEQIKLLLEKNYSITQLSSEKTEYLLKVKTTPISREEGQKQVEQIQKDVEELLSKFPEPTKEDYQELDTLRKIIILGYLKKL